MKSTPAFKPMRRAAIAGLAALMAGCGSLVDKPVPPALYDLGPVGAPGDTGVAPVGPPLILAAVAAAGGLDGNAVLYRLAYDNPQSLRPYAQARWSTSVPQLVHERIASRLARGRPVVRSGQLTAVPGPGGAPFVARVQLQEFAQHFDAPTRSRAVLRVQATALRASVGGDQLVAQRSFWIERPASTPDSAGGARALAEAVDELAAQLDTWLGSVSSVASQPTMPMR